MGYGYHGGGRPKKEPAAVKKTMSICGTEAELKAIRDAAEKSGMTVSQYVIDKLLK